MRPEDVRTPFPLGRRSFLDLLTSAASSGVDGDVVLRERDGRVHRVTIRGGRIVSARVAGRFDPLLERLRRRGAIGPEGHRRALEALSRSERRAGELAVEAGGAKRQDVEAALDRQTRERLAVIAVRAREGGRDAWVEPRHVSPSEVAARIDPRELHARPAPTPKPAPAPAAPPRSATADRRTLRRLAFLLHPDRHAHLSAEARESLQKKLAEVTAAHHGLGRAR